MSWPRVSRTVAPIPLASSVFWKASIAARDEPSYGEPVGL